MADNIAYARALSRKRLRSCYCNLVSNSAISSLQKEPSTSGKCVMYLFQFHIKVQLILNHFGSSHFVDDLIKYIYLLNLPETAGASNSFNMRV